jgi:hypothetical protein
LQARSPCVCNGVQLRRPALLGIGLGALTRFLEGCRGFEPDCPDGSRARPAVWRGWRQSRHGWVPRPLVRIIGPRSRKSSSENAEL